MKKFFLGILLGLMAGATFIMATPTPTPFPTPGRQIVQLNVVQTQVAAVQTQVSLMTTIDQSVVAAVNTIPTPVLAPIPTPPSF